MNTQVVLYTDMIGFKSLSVSSVDNKEDFNAIALDTQNDVAKQILGYELYNAFSTDIDGTGTPVEQKWIDFLNGVTWTEVVNEDDTTQNVIHNNEGIKNAWNYFVYYEWLQTISYTSTFTGKKTNNSINGTPLTRVDMNVESQNRYNKGAKIYQTVLDFLCYYENYKVDYTSIVDVAGTYTVNLADTTYLKNGDKVTIDSIDYVCANLVTDTSFEFVATTGLTFNNDFVTWFPFENVTLGAKKEIYFNGMI
jgi:hypothetical protein